MSGLKLSSRFAPGLLGAFFLALVACKDKDQTSDWSGHSLPAKEAPVAVAPPPVEHAPAKTEAAEAPVVVEDPADPSSVRFMTYNVENWLTMDRYVDGKSQKGAPKPD